MEFWSQFVEKIKTFVQDFVPIKTALTHKQFYNNAPHRKCLREKTTACVSLIVFFTIRCGTFPYSGGDDDANTTKPNPNHR